MKRLLLLFIACGASLSLSGQHRVPFNVDDVKIPAEVAVISSATLHEIQRPYPGGTVLTCSIPGFSVARCHGIQIMAAKDPALMSQAELHAILGNLNYPIRIRFAESKEPDLVINSEKEFPRSSIKCATCPPGRWYVMWVWK